MLSISSGTGGVNSAAPLALFEHANTVSSNYSIATNDNAISAGPIIVNSGVTVTIPTGSVWIIV